jgi:hypothetical protein
MNRSNRTTKKIKKKKSSIIIVLRKDHQDDKTNKYKTGELEAGIGGSNTHANSW